MSKGSAVQSQQVKVPAGLRKVSVNLPEDLVKLAKHAAIERNVNLQDLIAEGLRLALARKPNGAR